MLGHMHNCVSATLRSYPRKARNLELYWESEEQSQFSSVFSLVYEAVSTKDLISRAATGRLLCWDLYNYLQYCGDRNVFPICT